MARITWNRVTDSLESGTAGKRTLFTLTDISTEGSPLFALKTTLPTGRILWKRADPEQLKRHAEKVLATFVADMGAVFLAEPEGRDVASESNAERQIEPAAPAPWEVKPPTNRRAPAFNSAVRLSTLAGRKNFTAVVLGCGGDPIHIRAVGAVEGDKLRVTVWDGAKVSTSVTRPFAANTPVEVRG